METLAFKNLDWFEEIVNDLLIDQVKVLDQWRKQELAQSQRVKNSRDSDKSSPLS